MITKKGFLPRETGSGHRSIQVGCKTKTGKISLVGDNIWNTISILDYLVQVSENIYKEKPILLALQSTSGFYYSDINDDSSKWTVAAGTTFVMHIGTQETFYIKGLDGQEIEMLISVLGV